METQILVLKDDKDIQEAVSKASEIIKSGGLVAFPTETVYGLGASAFNEYALSKIYVAKGRPSDNPLIVHISNISQAAELGTDIPQDFYKLATSFWPGPLTMIVKKSDKVSRIVTGGNDTVALRMPNNKVALDLINTSGVPIAAPSANVSGKPSPTNADRVKEDMDGKIEAIIDYGDCEVGVESTVLDLTSPDPLILRPGFFGPSDLSPVLGRKVLYSSDLISSGVTATASPGTKYKHYAPAAPMTIVPDYDILIEHISAALSEGKKVGVLCSDSFGYVGSDNLFIYELGPLSDPIYIAQNLFEIFREFDDNKVDVIFSQSFGELLDEGGLGKAILDRLNRAASTIIE